MSGQAATPITSTSRKAERLAWPDAARGLSILGVMLLHACLTVPYGMETLPAQYNELLAPLRLPLFFLVSGFFSTKVLHSTLWDLCTRRLWYFIVPYVCWVPVEQWLKASEFAAYQDKPMPDGWFYWEAVTGGNNTYWFLYCLILCNLALWATRKLRPWLALLLSLSPVVLLVATEEWDPIVANAIMFIPVFFIGAHGRSLIAWFAEHTLYLWGLGVAALSYAAGHVLNTLWILRLEYPVEGWNLPGGILLDANDIDILVRLTVRLLMLPAAIALVVVLSRVPVINSILAFFGRHTLVLYLGHPLALTVLFNFQYRYEDIAFAEDTGNLWDSPTTWIGVCLVFALIGGMVFEALRQLPVAKWSVVPPSLAGVRWFQPRRTRFAELVAPGRTVDHQQR